MGEKKCTQIFVGRTEGMKLLGRPRNRRENNIKTDLIETTLESGDTIHLAQGKEVLKDLCSVQLEIPGNIF